METQRPYWNMELETKLNTQEMKEILPERVEALQLQSKLDPAMFKDLQRYMSGQVLSAKK